jgi:hypothetical protein
MEASVSVFFEEIKIILIVFDKLFTAKVIYFPI